MTQSHLWRQSGGLVSPLLLGSIVELLGVPDVLRLLREQVPGRLTVSRVGLLPFLRPDELVGLGLRLGVFEHRVDLTEWERMLLRLLAVFA